VPENLLCFGDNAYFLNERRDLFPDESVDLIYLDPPFNSKRPYNILFKDHKGTPSAAQIKAFDDTWTWDDTAQRNYEWLVTDAGFAPVALRKLVNTFHDFLGHSEMFAYLVQMATRLVMLHRVLKKTGSLYLHCDPTASHYLKLVLDGIFGGRNFCNEIIWCYRKWSNITHQFQRNHDVILFYCSDSRKRKFNPLYVPLSETTLKRFKGKKQVAVFEEGQRKPGSLNVDSGGTLMPDWWPISILPPSGKERLGYPTQKPLALLERIVAASSNPGDVVLDPFCGCGTTIDAVETLNRENPDQPARLWMGIDVTHLAINLIKHRLTRFEPAPKFLVVGEPEDLGGARELAVRDRYQFQYWALGLIGARPAASDQKKGSDKGIDGSFNFIDNAKGTARTVLVQVKSGKVKVGDLRDLKGVLDRERAEMGVFITLEPPTKPMIEEAVSAGYYHSEAWGKDYPRIQILTIEELLADPDRPHPHCLRTPPRVLGETFKEAPKHRTNGVDQLGLGG
jgi:site-specific DNA-methyltransferase (adenine-specific)